MGKDSVPYYKLFSFADTTDFILMIVGTLAAIGNGFSVPLRIYILGDLINTFGKTSDIQNVVHEISKVALKFIYLGVGTGVASFLQVACWTITGERQAARIRNLYLKALLRQDIEFFDMEANTGEVVGKMSGDIVLVQDAMGEKAGKFINLAASLIGGFVVAFIRGWKLTLVMMSCIPLVVLTASIKATVMTNVAARGQTAYSEAATIVEETISSIRTVVSFTGETQAVCKYKKSLINAYKASILEGFASGIGMGAYFGMLYCTYALGIWFGAKMILKSGYTGGDVINVISAVFISSSSLGQASPCTRAFASGQVAACKMFYTINRKPKIDAYGTSGKTLDDIRGDIELRDVCFSYPARPEEKIFSGFSLVIPCEATVALVGESGSGKSTVINLIERFYDPQAGEVLIDGVNLKEFQLSWIRGKIGLVSQEPVLFASSIRDNIAYGKGDATIEEIRAAVELANASKFIDKLPQGLDTMVGERGSRLSGGQKQRVAIARAILKDPRILLLDEATSALDSESESIVQEALDRIMTNRTTVVVAHRLSTVRSADMITVINQGSIVEKGSHDELLMDITGAYSQLIRLQEVNQDSCLNNSEDHMSIVVEYQSDEQTTSVPLKVRLSSDGICSDNSFSESFKLSNGVEIPENKQKESSVLEQPERHKEVPLSRLAYLNKPELSVILLGVIAAIASGLTLPIFGALLSSIIKTFYEPPQELQKDSNFWSLMFLILAFASFVSFPASTYFFAVAGSKLIKRIRLKSFDKAVHMEIGWFDNPMNSSGAVGARLSSDAATVRCLVGDALALVIQNISTLIASLFIALVACWQLALIILLLIPVTGLSSWVQMKVTKGFNLDAKELYEKASQVASDAVGSIRTVASFTAEDKVMELYKRKCKGLVTTSIQNGLITGIGFGFSFFIMSSFYATSFYAGARFIQDGKTTFGDVFRVFYCLSFISAGFSQYSSLGPDAKKAKSATASVFSILDRMSKIDSSDNSGMVLEMVSGNIEFQHVSFRYPTRPDVHIFQDLCLVVQSGKTVALVGESGCGKSTVVSLLQRFYDPDSGHILLDGVEIHKLKLRWLRQQMGLVSQEPVLFNDTIRTNISYGKSGEATEAEMLTAAELANAHHFISALHQGYDTSVGERGIQLSGGQKQRVAIARAIIKEPKILLLDEATSALDIESERVVQEALDRVMMTRTTIIIAHRLSTVRHADVIAVIRNGVVIEQGHHEELINVKDGAYASLVALS